MTLKAVSGRDSSPHYFQFDTLTQKFSEWVPRPRDIAVRAQQVAVPAMGLFLLSQIPTVGAGPIEYAACILGCTAMTGPAAVACFGMCLPVIFLPGP